MNITHQEVIEFRQRLAKLQRLRGDAAEEEIKMRRFLYGLATKYGVLGLRHQINPDTAEVEVYAEVSHYQALDSMMNAEKAAAGQNIWEGEGRGEKPVFVPRTGQKGL